MGRFRWILILLLAISSSIWCQTPDVLRIEYMLMPKNTIGVQTSRFKLVGNFPIPVREKKDFLVVGSEYNRFKYKIPEEILDNPDDLKVFHVLDVNFGYIYKWDENWRVIGVVTPRWASTFTNGVQKGDLMMNYMLGGFLDKNEIEKPFKLVVGLAYSSSSPVQMPLPVVYYEKRFHPDWAYILGVPKTGLKRFTKQGHFFQAELFLDGYYVNVQNDILLNNNLTSTDVSSTALLLTLGYQYKLAKNVSLYLLGGHTVLQRGVLRDSDRKEIFTLNDRAAFYFRTGFRIGI